MKRVIRGRRTPRRMFSILTTFGLVAGMLVGLAPSAFAAAPGNDNVADATDVASLPFSDSSVDTTEATTEATDPLTCSGAAHSVWYVYTAGADGFVNFNTFGSDFDTVLRSSATMTRVVSSHRSSSRSPQGRPTRSWPLAAAETQRATSVRWC